VLDLRHGGPSERTALPPFSRPSNARARPRLRWLPERRGYTPRESGILRWRNPIILRGYRRNLAKNASVNSKPPERSFGQAL
jgi:hypothetical protein